MKTFFRKTVLHLLITLARVRLKRLRPFVIGITGSIGKTSTKDAVFSLLQSKYTIIRNEKSFNSEFGLPLAILEQPSGFSSAFEWANIIVRGALKAVFGGENLQMMVLEMGVDKPGDMGFLLHLVRPQVAVLTNIKPVHLANGQFRDLEDIFLEKKKLVESLPQKGIAILNADDPYVVQLRGKTDCKQLWYGTSDLADIRVLDARADIHGIHCRIQYKNQLADGSFPLLGMFQIYVLLPAIAVGLTQGFTLEECLRALSTFTPPAGRMSKIDGVHGTTLLDSTYNASPEATKEALKLLDEIAPGRKIAVLGSMNELGVKSEEYHRMVGQYAKKRVDVLVTVGESAKIIGEEAQKEGLAAEDIYHYDDALEASGFLSTFVKRGDTILLKGSQNRVRLERLVKALMVRPEEASELLVRQEKAWEGKR